MFAKLHPIKLGLTTAILATLYQLINFVYIVFTFGIAVLSFNFLIFMLLAIAISFIPGFLLAFVYNYLLNK